MDCGNAFIASRTVIVRAMLQPEFDEGRAVKWCDFPQFEHLVISGKVCMNRRDMSMPQFSRK